MKHYNVIAGIALLSALSIPDAKAHEAHHHTTPEVTKTGLQVGGFANFGTGFVSQDLENESSNPVFYNDTQIHFKYLGVTDNGLKYGAVVMLEADVSEAREEQGLNSDKTFLFIEGGFGRFEAGSNTDAGSMLSVDAATFARATGGIHGDWWLISSFPEMGGHHGGHDSFLHAPSLPLHHQHGAPADATKVSYFTPRISGFQAGVSFIPDSGNVGTAAGFSGKVGHSDYNDVLNGGINYSGNIGDFKVTASLAGESGRSELPGHEKLAAYSAGLNLAYKDFTLGGSYGDWGKSLNHKSATTVDGSFWDIGAAYSYDKLGVSVGYFSSEYQQNEMGIFSISTDYQALPGLKPYAELTFADINAASVTIQDNNSTVLMTGILFSF